MLCKSWNFFVNFICEALCYVPHTLWDLLLCSSRVFMAFSFFFLDVFRVTFFMCSSLSIYVLHMLRYMRAIVMCPSKEFNSDDHQLGVSYGVQNPFLSLEMFMLIFMLTCLTIQFMGFCVSQQSLGSSVASPTEQPPPFNLDAQPSRKQNLVVKDVEHSLPPKKLNLLVKVAKYDPVSCHLATKAK